MATPVVDPRFSAPQTPIMAERDYDTLVSEGIALVPVAAPEWTDHNASDPGITLIELLAYFTDALLYRTGRITPAAKLQFLRLLKGAPDHDIVPLAQQADGTVDLAAELTRAIAETVDTLSQMECAVTCEDFERFARAAARHELSKLMKDLDPDADPVVGAHCIANMNLSGARMQGTDAGRRARGHVSIVLGLPAHLPDDTAPKVRAAVSRDLASRCLLTTRISVVAAAVLHVSIGFAVALLPGAVFEDALAAIDDALASRFGNADASGFGGTLSVSSIAMTIDAAPGVDYVEDVTVLAAASDPHVLARGVGVQVGAVATVGVDTLLGGPSHLSVDPDSAFLRFVRDSAGMLASVQLRPWEQLSLKVAREHVMLISADTTPRRRRP